MVVEGVVYVFGYVALRAPNSCCYRGLGLRRTARHGKWLGG